MSEPARRICSHGAVLFFLGLLNGASAALSTYAIWGALLLAAIFGTSGATPIAGAGYTGTAVQEALVTALLYAGSGGILVAAFLVILGLRARPGRGVEETS